MYDALSLLFLLCFTAFYFVFFALLVFWIVKPWLVPAPKKRILPIPRLVAERARLLQRPSDTSGEMKLRDTENQHLSSIERRLTFYALTWPPVFSRLPQLSERRNTKRDLEEKTTKSTCFGK